MNQPYTTSSVNKRLVVSQRARCSVSAPLPGCSGAFRPAQRRAAVVTHAGEELAQGLNQAGDAATSVVEKTGSSGPFDGLAHLLEGALTGIDGLFVKAGIPYSYGFAIIALTLIVKIATFPLTQKQVQSTVAIQALQPSVKELQSKYANDPQRLQLETSRLYKQANVNPLAGCLPTLATIPIFIGLYRALTLAAGDGLLQEGFFFIPSLGGPTAVVGQAGAQGTAWLFPFVDGAPPLGWADTAKYLVLPLLLIASQYASLQISSPKSDDPQVQSTQKILKFLPVLIGWFSLNVPSGLCVYWLTNNVLTTAQQVYLKSTTKVDVPQLSGGTIINTTATDSVGSEAASSGERRSRSGEKFRARTAATGGRDETLVANPRGKKKGAKFAERKKKAQDVKAGAGAPAATPVVASHALSDGAPSQNGAAPAPEAAKEQAAQGPEKA